MSHAITVHAASRLHFGLLSFGDRHARQYGGIGAMVTRPGLIVRFTRSDAFATSGPLAERVHGFARQWANYHRFDELPHCAIDVLSAPREHIGLGVGTQLAMATAAGLSALHHLPTQSAGELAASVGRTGRSAVGTYGFTLGGLIAERGKLPGEPLSPLDCHLDLPPDWRFVLIAPRDVAGIANDQERTAFANLPAVPAAVTADLTRLARERLLPAAAQGDFATFAASVYQYGRHSGECFASLQGGPYNGPRLAALVAHLRSHGVIGVGQSSWGPTIYVLARDDAEAQQVAALSRAQEPDAELWIAAPANQGARIEEHASDLAPACEQRPAR
jgi:beta-RFAP synthase